MKTFNDSKSQHLEELEALISSSLSEKELEDRLSDYHDNDIAEILEKLTPQERLRLYRILGVDRTAEIFAYLDDAGQVLCAALTSSIALTESAVSTFQDELKWGRKKATVFVGIIMVVLGSLSSLGYGPLACVKIIGMQFLDFFDFLTNSVMMPIAAIATCLLISRVVGTKKIEDEVLQEGGTFRRKKIFNFMIKYLCPIFAAIILFSSVANAFGWISM